MKYGFLWRTKKLVRLLINKCELSLSKTFVTVGLWFAKRNSNNENELIGIQMLQLVGRAVSYTNYGISMLIHKPADTNWIKKYNVAISQIGLKMQELVSSIN